MNNITHNLRNHFVQFKHRQRPPKLIVRLMLIIIFFESVVSLALSPARLMSPEMLNIKVNDTITTNKDLNLATDKCPSTFDGIYEWPMTPSNRTISMPCTVIFANAMSSMGVKPDEDDFQDYFARKICNSDGHWASNNWTNYTECLTLLALQERSSSATNQVQDIISYLVLILLIVSLVSLIIAIAIFTIFKPLQCLRIRIHKNLCVALLINCCLYILMNSLVGIHKLDLASMNDIFCKALKVLNVYTSMATVNWMFVEGFIFHRRLYAPFHQNTKLFTVLYYLIGWVLPAICVGSWALVLEFNSIVSNTSCWEGYRKSDSIFIVSLPMIGAVMINFIFLINIIRILMVKLKADNKSDHTTIKAIKATALLIPLLGIHHIVVFYNPSTFNRRLASVYIIINVLFQSIQGIIVAVLYCFTNHEVRTVLNSAWSRRRMSQSTHLSNNVNNNNNNSNNNRRCSTPAFIHQSSRLSTIKEANNNNNVNNNNSAGPKRDSSKNENIENNNRRNSCFSWFSRMFGRVFSFITNLKPKTVNQLVTVATGTRQTDVNGNKTSVASKDESDRLVTMQPDVTPTSLTTVPVAGQQRQQQQQMETETLLTQNDNAQTIIKQDSVLNMKDIDDKVLQTQV